MPVTLVRDCPHCGAGDIAMRAIDVVSTMDIKSTAMFSCNRCREILCISYLHPVRKGDWVLGSIAGDFDTVAHDTNSTLIRQYPASDKLEAPKSVSQVVERAFIQGLDNARRGYADAAASMFRKALDAATRELDQSSAGKPLARRIDLLAESGRLTPDLKEWAHLIRLDGNQGVHDDEELSAEEIEQLKDFTELFLIYAFTLPAQVSARKEAAKS